MIRPVLADEAFLDDVARARADTEAFHLWWLGQSGFLVQWQGRHLLLDPYLSDALAEKYAGTGRPHDRLTARVVAPERLDFVDVVAVSHHHGDHFDPETLEPLLRVNPDLTLVVPQAHVAAAAGRLGLLPTRPVGLDDGRSVSVAGFRITGVPAAHEALERDDEGHHRYLGYVVAFGPWTLYHSGDTVRYDGQAERLRAWTVDVALLPINGRAPDRGVAGNLDGPEAAHLARDAGARLAIPCHYDLFAFNTASPDAFVAEAARIGQPCAVLHAGERFSWTVEREA